MCWIRAAYRVGPAPPQAAPPAPASPVTAFVGSGGDKPALISGSFGERVGHDLIISRVGARVRSGRSPA